MKATHMSNELSIVESIRSIYERIKKSPEYVRRLEKTRLEKRQRHFSNGVATYQDKPPKLKFRPGSFVQDKKKYKGQLYEILYCYRVRDNPHEWLFYLEERNDLKTPETIMSYLCEQIAGYEGNRIAYQLFSSTMDAESHFSNVYHHADGRIVSNKTLLNEFELISSGEVI